LPGLPGYITSTLVTIGTRRGKLHNAKLTFDAILNGTSNDMGMASRWIRYQLRENNAYFAG